MRGRWVIAVVLLVALGAACTESEVTVVGIVIGVEGDLTSVEAFTLRTDRGEVLTLEPDAFGDYAFPLPHLSEHARTLEPVRVTYRRLGDGSLLATVISDA